MKLMTRVIGIDPGVKTGFAEIVDGGQFVALTCLDFWRAHRAVLEHDAHFVDVVVIEVAKETTIYARNRGARSMAAMARTGQHVGAVRREGELLAEGLQRMGYNVKTVPPRGKVNADVFQAVTGYEGRTNEHTRDAGMMAWNEYHRLRLQRAV